MADTANRLESLRPNLGETGRLGLVLALSLAAHLLAWGGYEIGREFGIWQRLPQLVWFQRALKMAPPPAQTREQPLEFVMVEQPSTTPPQNAKYYSSQNSIAANPDANRNEKNPQLNGKQTEVPKAETVTKPDFNKLQPTQQPMSREQRQSSPAVEPGDLTLANPKELQQQPQQPERPRTLAQALHQLPGVMMQQDGGVQRHAVVPSFDVKVTGYGAYDERFVEAVSQRWWDLLDSRHFALDRSGKVVLRFRLNFDGTISDMSVAQNDVGELLGYVCQKAVLDGAPFEQFSRDMRRELGDFCNVQFTFYYY